MLVFLQGKASERKLFLFAVACCRRIWDVLDETGREAVEIAERYADGRVSVEERARTENLAWWGADGLNYEEEHVWMAGWAAHAAIEGSVLDTAVLAVKAARRE